MLSMNTVIEHVDLFGNGSGATLSPCKQYRYSLWRRWDKDLPVINFLMLNPSTADDLKNDATVERCERRATRLGYGSLIVTNLFAYRATYPVELKRVADPVGTGNDDTILEAAQSDAVVCAWGCHGLMLDRQAKVLSMLRATGLPLHHLGMNSDGTPKHPLYIPYEQPLTEWIP